MSETKAKFYAAVLIGLRDVASNPAMRVLLSNKQSVEAEELLKDLVAELQDRMEAANPPVRKLYGVHDAEEFWAKTPEQALELNFEHFWLDGDMLPSKKFPDLNRVFAHMREFPELRKISEFVAASPSKAFFEIEAETIVETYIEHFEGEYGGPDGEATVEKFDQKVYTQRFEQALRVLTTNGLRVWHHDEVKENQRFFGEDETMEILRKYDARKRAERDREAEMAKHEAAE